MQRVCYVPSQSDHWAWVRENETLTQATKTFCTSLVQSRFHGSSLYYNTWQQRKGFSKIRVECSSSSIPSTLRRIFRITLSYYISLPAIAVCSSVLLMADLNSLSSSFRRPFNNVKASMGNVIIQTSSITVLDILLCSMWFSGGCVSCDCC